MKLRFDQGPNGNAQVFQAPDHVIRADRIKDVPAALEALEAAQAKGAWLAGFATYELGYAFEDRLLARMPKDRRLPLLQFGVYDAPRDAAPLAQGPVQISELTAAWSAQRYSAAFDALHAHIQAGNIYQANLTFPISGKLVGTPEALYARLAQLQKVNYGVMVEQEGQPTILSRSPELFFKTDASGKIETRPMKGTQPRGADPVEDAARAHFLKNDVKNQAENLMIVDLLRNDISRICEVGSVRVPELFSIESYETVHQMVSHVVGQLRPHTGIGDIFRALFPCGSITGAPKLRAMEIINDLEETARDIYCGTIGWIAPDGASEFNVAIRTALVDGAKVTLNVGGGVVYDSTSASEYEEARWKSRYISQLDPKF